MSEEKQTLEKVKITVLKVTFDDELAKEYAVPGYPPCVLHKEGEVFYSNGSQKPAGLCDYAWNSIRDYVMPIAMKGGYIFGEGNWLRHKNMAIVSCSDGIKPVIFKVEGTDMDADVLEGDLAAAANGTGTSC